MQHIKRRQFLSLAFGCLIIIQSCPTGAADVLDDLLISPPALPSILSLELGANSDKGQDIAIYGNFAISSQHRVSAGYDDNSLTVTTSEEDLETNSFSLGYSYLVESDNSQYGIEYEEWGEDDKLTTETLKVSGVFDMTGNISVSVEPQIRAITVYGSTPVGASGKERDTLADLNSFGLRVSLNYFSEGPWSIGTSYLVNSYSDDPEDYVSEDDLLALGRLQTVSDKSQATVSFNYQYNTEVYGFLWARSRSAIDSALSFLTSFSVSSDILSDWTMSVSGGWQNNIDNTITGFIGGSLSYYW